MISDETIHEVAMVSNSEYRKNHYAAVFLENIQMEILKGAQDRVAQLRSVQSMATKYLKMVDSE
jgi:hypothetical protein